MSLLSVLSIEMIKERILQIISRNPCIDQQVWIMAITTVCIITAGLPHL